MTLNLAEEMASACLCRNGYLGCRCRIDRKARIPIGSPESGPFYPLWVHVHPEHVLDLGWSRAMPSGGMNGALGAP